MKKASGQQRPKRHHDRTFGWQAWEGDQDNVLVSLFFMQ